MPTHHMIANTKLSFLGGKIINLDVTLIRRGIEKITSCQICQLPLMCILENGCGAELAVFGALVPEHAFIGGAEDSRQYHCRGTGLQHCEQSKSSVSFPFTAPAPAANVLDQFGPAEVNKQIYHPSYLFKHDGRSPTHSFKLKVQFMCFKKTITTGFQKRKTLYKILAMFKKIQMLLRYKRLRFSASSIIQSNHDDGDSVN